MGETGSEIADGGDDSEVGEELSRLAVSMILKDWREALFRWETWEHVGEMDRWAFSQVSGETSDKLRTLIMPVKVTLTGNGFNNRPKWIDA